MHIYACQKTHLQMFLEALLVVATEMFIYNG